MSSDQATHARVDSVSPAEWAGSTGFARMLGIGVEDLSTETARLSLPYRPELSNGDGALHGGVAASMIATSAGALSRSALGADSGPWHTASIQVAYLAAAIEEGLTGHARLLRKGKELAYVDVDVRSDAGKPIARGLATVRGRFGAEPAPAPEQRAGDEAVDEGSDPGPMGPFIASIPFHGALGLAARHMTGGRSIITMAAEAATRDGDGAHEGALLALVDTAGAMSAWAKTGPGRFKASTPGMAARILEPAPRGDVVGYGRVIHHDRELIFCAVEIRTAFDGRLVADGSVNYRIVTPDLTR